MLRIFALASIFFVLLTSAAYCQAIKPVQIKEKNIKLELPSEWQYEWDKAKGHILMYSSDRSAQVVIDVIKDSSMDSEDHFGKMKHELSMKNTSKILQENINGIKVLKTEGSGNVSGQAAEIILLTGVYKNYTYIAYGFTSPALFNVHSSAIRKIIHSIAPLN
ncbi:MAG: hypothetical protein RML72_01205 [Bacteroidia bacterium]|nr:hypothetical protein [Bacteroidia bacterium]MDW8157478.1 hypothetical protein [Bacteroidia bacterium]